jgi:hypothetical protein
MLAYCVSCMYVCVMCSSTTFYFCVFRLHLLRVYACVVLCFVVKQVSSLGIIGHVSLLYFRMFSFLEIYYGPKERKDYTQLVTVTDSAAYASYKIKANT